MTGHFDLGYFNRPSDWDMGWRPDDFFSLPKAEQRRIERRVSKAGGDWRLATRLVREATLRHDGEGSGG